jgi:thiol-disulfide isomerase/thioredoxin
MPDWEKFKEKVNSMKQKLNDKGITVTINQFESVMKDKMRENKIKQYPTIKVKIEEDYTGDRASKEIKSKMDKLNNESDNLLLEYFYSNKCKHCINFMPEWEKVKKNKGDIEIKEYEESKSMEIMDKRDIEGDPTLRISREITLTENRDLPTLLGFIDKEIFGLQSGGGNNYYYVKYLKYKKKYEELKNKQK